MQLIDGVRVQTAVQNLGDIFSVTLQVHTTMTSTCGARACRTEFSNGKK
jgi:hypothetical protein